MLVLASGRSEIIDSVVVAETSPDWTFDTGENGRKRWKLYEFELQRDLRQEGWKRLKRLQERQASFDPINEDRPLQDGDFAQISCQAIAKELAARATTEEKEERKRGSRDSGSCTNHVCKTNPCAFIYILQGRSSRAHLLIYAAQGSATMLRLRCSALGFFRAALRSGTLCGSSDGLGIFQHTHFLAKAARSESN